MHLVVPPSVSPRLDRTAITLRVAAEVIVIIATIVVSMVWTAIAIAPIVFSRIAIVVAAGLGTEAIDYAAASSTQARTFAALTFMRASPGSGARTGRGVAIASASVGIVRTETSQVCGGVIHLERVAICLAPNAPAAAPASVVSLLLPNDLPANPPANAPPTDAARLFSRRSMLSNLSRTLVMRESSRRWSLLERD